MVSNNSIANHYCPQPISSRLAFEKATRLLKKDQKVHVVFFCHENDFNDNIKSENPKVSNIEWISAEVKTTDDLFESRIIIPVVNSIKSQQKRVYLFSIKDFNQYKKIVSSDLFSEIKPY